MGTSASISGVDCPLAPKARQTTYARVLHRACLILGGVPALATQLRVTEVSLRAWLEGLEEPPDDVFLFAVGLILLYVEDSGRA